MMFLEKITTRPSGSGRLLVVLMAALVVAAALAMAFAADAEAKKKKKKKPVTVQQLSSNTQKVTIPSDAPVGGKGPADLYPSPNNVTIPRLASGVLDANVNLTGLKHSFPDDLDMMLAAPGGQCAIFMSDAGANRAITNPINLRFDQQATTPIPDTPATALTTGTFQPANYQGLAEPVVDPFPAPAPNPATCSDSLSVFNGINPNGQWRLFVVDDSLFDVGEIASGWSLEVTAKVKPKKKK